jgi:hypothetical protein
VSGPSAKAALTYSSWEHRGWSGKAGRTAAGPSGWTTGRIISVVIGAVLVLCSLGLLGGGAGAVWATTAHRHDGYVDLGTQTYHTNGYALSSQQIELSTATGNWDVARSLFGTVRLRVTSTPGGTPIFAGIAPAAATGRYLSGVAYATVTGTTRGQPSYTGHAGGAPAVLPAQAGIWAVKATGPGTQTLTWPSGQRPMDRGRHERRRIRAGERPGERRRHAARIAVGRHRPADRGRDVSPRRGATYRAPRPRRITAAHRPD